MIRTLDRVDATSLALLGGATAVTAALYGRLPARVPVHFDLNGHVDGWMDKAIGAWLLIAIALLTWLLLRFGALLAPNGFGRRLAASPVAVVGVMTVALFVALHVIVLWSALHPGASMATPLFAGLGVYWVALAQVLPRVRRNPFVGVRTSWTMSSDENWARTHRVAGWLFTLGGIVAVFGALLGAPAVALAAILVSALAPVAYSFIVARREV